MAVYWQTAGSILTTRRTNKCNTAGFTLVELLVVLGILAGVAAVIGAYARPVQRHGTVLQIAQRLSAHLRRARTLAVQRRRFQEVRIDLDRQAYWIIGYTGDRRQLPHDIAIRVVTAKPLLRNGNASLRFFPDGTSTGGRVTLERKNRSARVDINWMTGAVRVSNPK